MMNLVRGAMMDNVSLGRWTERHQIFSFVFLTAHHLTAVSPDSDVYFHIYTLPAIKKSDIFSRDDNEIHFVEFVCTRQLKTNY